MIRSGIGVTAFFLFMFSWVELLIARTITATFPSGDATVARLNDTWLIYNNTFTLVEANPLNTARNAYLKLNKK
jgi:hypothetical protein